MSSKNTQVRRSISQDLMTGLVMTVLIISVIAISVSYYLSSKKTADELAKRSDELVTSISQNFKIPLWTFDNKTIESMGQPYQQSEIISELKIINSEGQTVFEFHKDAHSHQHLIQRNEQIFYKNKLVGSFTLGLSEEYFTKTTQSFLWQFIALIFLIVVSILIIGRILLINLLEKRIDEFREMVANYQSDGLNVPVNFSPAKEFSLFFDVLNKNVKVIKKHIAEINKQKSKAEAANIAKSEFLDVMSHELRTPMNAIIGFGSLLKKSDLNEKQHGHIDKILSASEYLMGHIQNMLDYSNIEKGDFVANSTKFNVKDTLDPVFNSFADKSKHKGIIFSYSLDSQIPAELIGDDEHLKSIINKITDNAIKFSRHGGKVSVRLNKDSETDKETVIHLEIADSGIGIESERLEHLFEKFTQADSSNTRKYGGVGLGLSLTKHLVSVMNGKIRVESERDVGTTFHVTLPFKKADT